VPETALVRRINRSANRSLEPADYRPLVRELLAHQTLSHRAGSPRLALPPDVHPWAQEVAESWRREVEQRGYDVIGDLADLSGAPAPAQWADPDQPSEKQVASAALDAIKALLLENARLRRAEANLAGQLHDTQAALHRSYLRPTYRLREKAVRRLQGSRAGRGLLKAYRLGRGRSSLSA
jgi:hypothetical protein